MVNIYVIFEINFRGIMTLLIKKLQNTIKKMYIICKSIKI